MGIEMYADTSNPDRLCDALTEVSVRLLVAGEGI